MIKLEDKPNVIAPNADYPYGDIKDDTGIDDGTPVDREVYADHHQFFAKMFAESGLTANDLPDNATNGFQLYQALIENMKLQASNETLAFNGIFNEDLTSLAIPGNKTDFFIKNDIMYLVDSSTSVIRRYNLLTNTLLPNITTAFAPQGIFVTESRIYVTRSTPLNRAVVVYDLDGVLQAAEGYLFSTSALVNPTKIHVSASSGNLIAYVADVYPGGPTEGVIYLNLTAKTTSVANSIVQAGIVDFSFYDTGVFSSSFLYIATKTQIIKYSVAEKKAMSQTITVPETSTSVDQPVISSIHVYGGKIYCTTYYFVMSPTAQAGIFAFNFTDSGTTYGSFYRRNDSVAGLFIYKNKMYYDVNSGDIKVVKQNLLSNPSID